MKLTSILLTALLSVGLAPSASAQDFPTRPVTMVVPSPPGSALDNFGRVLSEELRQRWGQTVIVENKAGAGGVIAATTVVSAAPDGYTLFLLQEQLLVTNRFAYRKLPYDPDKSFTPIDLLVQSDQMVVANASAPFRDLAGLVAYSKANPKSLAYGYWSSGSSPNLVFEALNVGSGSNLLGVPYKGVGPVMQAMAANEVQLTVMSAVSGAPLLNTGKAIPLASASATRSPQYPNIPTTVEQGFPQLKASTWYGLVGPAGMPKALVDKIQRDVHLVIKDPGFFDRNPGLRGWTVVAGGPQGLTDLVKEQVPVIEHMMKAAKVEPQ